MVLSGWTEATSVVEAHQVHPNANAGSTSSANANAGSTSSASELEAERNNEIESATGKKRKLSEVSEAVNPDMSSVAAGDTSQGNLEVLDDDDDDIVIFDDWDSATNKKKRLQ